MPDWSTAPSTAPDFKDTSTYILSTPQNGWKDGGALKGANRLQGKANLNRYLVTSLGEIEVFRSTQVKVKYFTTCPMLRHRPYTLVHARARQEQVVYVIIRRLSWRHTHMFPTRELRLGNIRDETGAWSQQHNWKALQSPPCSRAIYFLVPYGYLVTM